MKLEDIALECGVSVSTVSRAMNNDPRISRETTQRVHEIALQHNFIPSKRKRPITRSTLTLLVVIPDSEKVENNPFFDMGELINAINSAFVGENKKIETITFSQLNHMISGKDLGYDGILFAFGSIETDIKDYLEKKNIPYIFLNRTFDHESYVSCNNFKGVIKLMEYLSQKGLKRIGYLGCPNIAVNKDRFRGYCVARYEATGKLDNELVLNVESINDIDETSAQFFKDKKCDAVIGFNDNFSIRLISAFQQINLKVPDDISVTGFDNSPMRKIFKPLVTTISLSTFEMGFFASRWLCDNIQHRETRPLRLEVDGILLDGESVL